MIKRILFSLLGISSLSAAPDYQKFIEHYEGNKSTVYDDGNGIKSVGIGHKLLFSDKIKNKYTQTEIQQFFLHDLSLAIEGVKKQIGSDRFNNLPDDVKEVCVSLCFNVGQNGYGKFILFNESIKQGNFSMAAMDLFASKWAKELPRRASESIMILRKHVGIILIANQ